MTLVKKTVQKISLGAFYGTSLFMANASSVFASTKCDPASGSVASGVDCAADGSNLADTTLFGDGGIVPLMINTLLTLVGVISVIMLIIGGIRYIISSGDQNAVTTAKNTILYAIIGLIIALLSYAAISFITGNLAS